MKDPKQMSWTKRNFHPYDAEDFAQIDWRPGRVTWVGWIAMGIPCAILLATMWADMIGNQMGWWCDAPNLYREPTAACSAAIEEKAK